MNAAADKALNIGVDIGVGIDITDTAQVVSRMRCRVGESPVWSAAEQALYWIDIEGRQLHRLHWPTRQQSSWTTHERPGCIALTAPAPTNPAQGSVVIAAMETGIYALQLSAAPMPHAQLLLPITHPQPHMRFNDGRCDALGRLWVSTMCMDMSLAAPVGQLFCVSAYGLGTPLVDDLVVGNGLAFSPDGTRLYLSDSHATRRHIWVYDLDLPRAQISQRVEFTSLGHLSGRPDGAAVDAEGCYWSCANDAGYVYRFSPDGELLSRWPVPVSKPSMCAFGGDQLDVLFITSIEPATPSDTPELDGALFALHPGVQGRAEPLFDAQVLAALGQRATPSAHSPPSPHLPTHPAYPSLNAKKTPCIHKTLNTSSARASCRFR